MKSARWAVVALVAILIPTALSAWTLEDDDNQLFSLNGHMQYRGRIYNLDFNDASNASHLNRVNYYGDLSLNFRIQPSEYVTANFEMNRLIFFGQQFRYNTIQTGEDVLPEEREAILNLINTSTGATEQVETSLPLRLNTDEAWELHMRQAWMDIKMPKYPFKLKFGRQPFILGNGIYTNTNIASVFGYQFYSDFGPGKPFIRLGSMKYYEGARESFNTDTGMNDADDADLYFVDGKMMIPNMDGSDVGAFVTYFNDRSFGMDHLYHYNVGLTANLSLPMGIKLSSEFDYQMGKKDYYNDAAGSDFDWTGYAFMAKAAIPPVLDNKLALAAEFGIGSGDDPNTADFEGYVGVGPFYPYAWAYEYRFIHSIHNASGFFGKYSKALAVNLAPGMENTTYAKATGVVSLPLNAKYIVSPIWLGMTQEGESFGYELDNIITIPLYQNFSYQFIFAYVIPSDYIKDMSPSIKDNAYGIRSQLQVTF